MIRTEMHPVANEVDVPTDEVERYLLQWAEPGFTGQREVHLRVLPEAGLSVQFIPAGTEVQTKDRGSTTSPRLNFGIERAALPPTGRQLKVRAQLAQNKYRFRLGMKLTAVIANYVDGNLTRLEWKTVG